jgi:cysteinyl-tRNA synthetase
LAAEVNRTQSAELSGLLKALGGVLGLLQTDPLVFLQTGNNSLAADETIQINELIAARAAAKLAKDFAKADQIRQQLLGMGLVLKDSVQGTQWERA